MNIVISGTVGVGKTTISKKLKERFLFDKKNANLINEILEKDIFLEKYYSNINSWSLLIQINFVLNRFKNSYLNSNKHEILIYDRHFLDDFIIASMPIIKNNMLNLNWESYSLINNELNNKLKEFGKVDYFFLIKADFEKVIERIKNRGREFEKQVNKEYWKNMYNQYYLNKNILRYIKKNCKNFFIIDSNSSDINLIVDKIIKEIK